LEPKASQALRSLLANKGIQKAVRIDLRFSGCCDSSLSLYLDDISESDLTCELDGLKFVIAPEIYQLAGQVSISYVDEPGKKGFVLRPSKTVGEWDGFGVCDLARRAEPGV